MEDNKDSEIAMNNDSDNLNANKNDKNILNVDDTEIVENNKSVINKAVENIVESELKSEKSNKLKENEEKVGIDKHKAIINKEIEQVTKNKPAENKEIIKEELKSPAKPIKELPIEKKPFNQFINEHLIPEIKIVFKEKGKEIKSIKMSNTNRPIAGDECWVIYCEIKETCCFWLCFDKDDITSPKSFSLCRMNEKPSVIESFLIDEKKITLKLIISRILQRLNGQKLLGAN